MFKKGAIIFLAVLLVGVYIGLVLAAEKKGNDRKGKYLFRKNCRSCHVEGGSAKELSPVSKTQAEWEKAFKEYESLSCKDEWRKLSDQDRLDIFTYLHEHAYDSPSPIKCS